MDISAQTISCLTSCRTSTYSENSDRMGVSGGAYLGVGPDQSFTYIARIKPRIAFMIDIRRDCLLQHLLFKSVFMMSRNRIEYMSLLMGRPVPRDARQVE